MFSTPPMKCETFLTKNKYNLCNCNTSGSKYKTFKSHFSPPVQHLWPPWLWPARTAVGGRCLRFLGLCSELGSNFWRNLLIAGIYPAANALRHVLMSPPYSMIPGPLQGPDCFTVSNLCPCCVIPVKELHLPRPLHGPDCFTVSILCKYLPT